MQVCSFSLCTLHGSLNKLHRIHGIKCDKQRPACQRCFSTGRRCDGYDHYSLNRPFTQSSSDVEERRLFHLFRTFTSNQFSGDFESSFWSRIMLPACHVNSSLRHAAIALASLHEDFIVGKEMANSQQSTLDISSYALRQYTKAIKGTRMFLNDKARSIIVTLMSCVLFFCFESLRGQLASSVIHLRSGLDILRLFYLQADGLSIDSKTVIKDDILSVFARLGFQANYFVDRTHPINQLLVVRQLQSLSTHRLRWMSTLEEARAGLYACLNGIMFSDHAKDPISDVNSFCTQYHMTRCAQLILFGDRSAQFVKGRERALSALEEWLTSFKEFVRAQEGFMDSKDIKGSTLLKLHHLVAVLMLTTACGCPKEKTDFESAMRSFKQLLEWPKFLLMGNQSIMTAVTPALSPDVGIIAPMFFVASKCTGSTLRVEAKEILASGPHREGIWDESVAVKIIEDLNIQAV
jgi:hypothetical protein